MLLSQLFHQCHTKVLNVGMFHEIMFNKIDCIKSAMAGAFMTPRNKLLRRDITDISNVRRTFIG